MDTHRTKYMKEFKLNVCSMGHPLDVKTWSATPNNICNELKKSGSLGETYDVTFDKENKFNTFIVKAASAIYYYRSKGISNGTLYRNYRSKKLSDLLSPVSHTLHFGTSSTPFHLKKDHQKHYLYTDSTWNLWANSSTEMNGYSLKLVKDAERLEAEALSQFTHIFSISEYVKENLINHYRISPKKITVVGTGRGILDPFFGTKDYYNGKILFTAKGRFKDKGGDLVVSAFQKAYEKNQNLHLTIVGQNEYSSQINSPGITALGFIPLQELQALFNTHSLFMMPAGNEPWGLVYIEALACKMPIIGLNKNAFPEISGNGKYGYIVDSANSDDLSDLILKAMANYQELQEKGLNGQEYCLKTFSWDKVVNTIITTIKENYLE